MHELSLLSDLLKKIEALAIEQDAKKVTLVKVKIGALAHISASHFEEHFLEGIKNTIAENAKLDIETSADINDSNAQDILLKSIDVEC